MAVKKVKIPDMRITDYIAKREALFERERSEGKFKGLSYEELLKLKNGK